MPERLQNYDDEQIAKYGLFHHLRAVAAPFNAEQARKDAELVTKNIDKVLDLLSDSEEDRARATIAIPHVISSLALGDIARSNWREIDASLIYDDWLRRTGQKVESVSGFFKLSSEEQEPFLKVIDAVIKVREAK